MPTLCNTVVYSTHKDEFDRVFHRPDGKVYKKDWENLVRKLFIQYQPLIYKVMRNYPSIDKTICKSACIQGFYEGLRVYVNKEIYNTGIHLCAHLKFYMRGTCQKEIRDDTPIHIPNNHHNDFSYLVRNKCFDRHYEELNEHEQNLMDIHVKYIKPLMELSSLDKASDSENNEGDKISDIIPDKKILDAIRSIELASREKMLIRNIKKLGKIEQYCLIYHFGICGYEQLTLREISAKVGFSHTKVSSIIVEAKKKLVNLIFENENLSDYTDSTFLDYEPKLDKD